MSPDGGPSADAADVGPLRRLFEEKHEQFLKFVRWRSPAALSARRDPEDVLQSAFVQAQRRLDDFARSGMALEAWFYRVILNCLLDDRDFQTRQRRDYRAEVAFPDQSSAQAELGLHAPVTSPSVAAGRHELRERIERVLARLSDEHQQIMVLIHYADLTKEQAAELLGLAGGTARQRYARARTQFREQWKACFGDEGLVE